MSRRRQTLYDVLRSPPEVRTARAKKPHTAKAGGRAQVAVAQSPAEIRVRLMTALLVLAFVLGLGGLLGYLASRSSRSVPRLETRSANAERVETTNTVLVRSYSWEEGASDDVVRREIEKAKDDEAFLTESGYKARIVGNLRRRVIKVCVGTNRDRGALEALCDDIRVLVDTMGVRRFPDAFVSEVSIKKKS